MSERLTLSPREVGERLGVSRKIVYTLIATRQLPSVLVGSRRLVPISALETWVAKNTVEREEVMPARRRRR